MDLQTFLKNRETQHALSPRFRDLCTTCLQPDFGCYCAEIKKVDPFITFVILIHPMEVRRRIATGRMTHLCLQDSYLVHGLDYSVNPVVNALLQDPQNQCVLLYPGQNSINLSAATSERLHQEFSGSKKLVIFVVDGTWATAKKMVRLSQNLHSLPRICFTPVRPSNFRVRKQPAAHCFSTIEAVHQMIDMLGPARQFDVSARSHDRLLRVFDFMVERQLDFIRKSASDPKFANYTHRRSRKIPA